MGDEPGSAGTLPRRVEKPWGYEIIWAHTDRYVGKVLHIEAGRRLSYQYHQRKEETLRVQSGRMCLTYDEGAGPRQIEMGPGAVFHVRPGTKHRMEALTDVDVIEVSTPELDDVVRLADDYGREGTSAP
ncbi:MAG: cupin domain-containing protein [Deltaproteobacteria bacterium]|nr:MAG: cupin domain-containing protein [Deltaproteobacteria bacterium]